MDNLHDFIVNYWDLLVLAHVDSKQDEHVGTFLVIFRG